MKAKNENTKFVVGSTCSDGHTTIVCEHGCDMTGDVAKCFGESSDEDSDEEENDSDDDEMKCMSICMRHSGANGQAACESEHNDNCKCKWDWPTCEPDDE